MLKVIGVICVCLATFLLFGQVQPKYEVATIMDVKVHQDPPSDVVGYDVTVKVGGTIYVVLYTPPSGENADIKYAGGRELLVLIGKKTITYNDMLGRSFEAPIVSQRPAAKEAK